MYYCSIPKPKNRLLFLKLSRYFSIEFWLMRVRKYVVENTCHCFSFVNNGSFPVLTTCITGD